MINAEYYLNMDKEEFLKFYNLTEILPIDDELSYNGHVYKLTNYDMQVLSLTRIASGYEWNYSGPEKKPGDARHINMMDHVKIKSIVGFINNEIEHNNIVHKEIG